MTVPDLQAFILQPVGTKVVMGGIDIDELRRLAESSGLAVQNITLDLIQHLHESGESGQQIVKRLGL